jgi:pilus assembly protein CpaC
MTGICHFTQHTACRILLAILLAVLFIAVNSSGWTQTSSAVPPTEKLMYLGSSELLDFQGIERLAVSDPAVIDYVVLSKIQVMLVAKKTGEGDLYIWDKSGRHDYHVIVTPPPSRMSEIVMQIKQAIARPLISVSEHNEVIVLEGEVWNEEEAKRADVIAKAYAPKVANLIRVISVPVSEGTQPVAVGPPMQKSLTVGGSELLDFRGVERVTISDPSVLDYVELSKVQVMIVAKKPGEAHVYVWDRLGPHPYHITVTPPPSRMPEIVGKIKLAIDRPEISISEHNETVILDGELATAEEVKRAEAIARVYVPNVVNLLRLPAAVKPVLDLDEIQRVMGTGIRISTLTDGLLLLEGVATPAERARLDQILQALGDRISVLDMVTTSAMQPRQILVRVKAVEINRSALRELGVEWGGLNEDGAHDQPILFGEVLSGPIPIGDAGPFRRLDALSARLKALTTTNRARILAEPNLLVVEGQLAEILVGGEIPIPVSQTVGTGSGTVSVEWKEFGVKMAMKAFISSDGENINLDVAPEVSNLDFGNAIVVGGIRLPALQTRRVHSVLHVRDGQTLVIGGLYQVEHSRTVRKIPLLGDIPLIGNLFKRTDKQQRDTELVIFVTPEIVTEESSTARTQDELRKMGEVIDGVE